MLPLNPALGATFRPPVMEARRWLADAAFPPDRPLINVSQAAPVDPPPEGLRRAIAEAALDRPEALNALSFDILRQIGAAFDEEGLRALMGDRIETVAHVAWSRREGRVLARRQDRLGALVLSDAPLDDPDPRAVAQAALDGLRDLGLPWTPAAARLRARIALVEGMPDGGKIHELAGQPSAFSPDYAPEEMCEIAARLTKAAHQGAGSLT